jgi:tetratricopeptide (TPR) repeat protein
MEISLGKKDDARKDVEKAADLGNKEAAIIVQQYFQVLSEGEINSRVKTQDSLALIYPNRPEPFYNISNIYFEARQYKKAIEFCDKAISIDTNYAPAYYNKGACLMNLEQRANGCELINKAAGMGFEMALHMKPTCDAILKGK